MLALVAVKLQRAACARAGAQRPHQIPNGAPGPHGAQGAPGPGAEPRPPSLIMRARSALPRAARRAISGAEHRLRAP